MKIELSKPINYKDAQLTSLELDLESMTGKDLLSVETELRGEGVNVAVWEMSRAFLIAVAARASHLPVEVLRDLNVKDFTRVVNETVNFLFSAA